MSGRPSPFASLHRAADQVLARASLISPIAARHAGLRLLRMGRAAEAEPVVAAAVARFPRHAGLAARYALVSEAAGCGPRVALDRWRRACAMGPGRATTWREFAACARRQGEIDHARQGIAEAMRLSPGDWRVRLEAALVAEAAEDFEAAHDHWLCLVARHRVEARWSQGLATVLIKQDRLDDAQRVLDTALTRYPNHRDLLFISAQLAMRRHHVDEAFAIVSALIAANPDDIHAVHLLERVGSIRQLARQSPTRDMPPQLRAPADVERVEDETLRQLMLRFEGIGTDCEFGTVQRRFGAEPLGLLRWNDVAYESLVAALLTSFSGLGEPDQTELVAGSIGELYMRDRRWGLGMHTFFFEGETSPETLFPKMCRRICFLRDKFLVDLAAGEKILVFKARDLAYDELTGLHDLLKRFGPVRLLHVRDMRCSGTKRWPAPRNGVSALAPDLLVGYVSRMGDIGDVPYDEWVAICRATAAVVDDASALLDP